jgi:hypothetical protein
VSDELHDAELHGALHRLAGRGSPRGFDAVLAGAAASAERQAIEAERVQRESGESGDLDPIPFVTMEPPARRRRPLGALIAAAGLAALLVVGTLAVSAVFGNSGTGSKSAEGAVRQLADALSHEDPLAAAQVLAPDEVRSLPGTIQSAERKASELQLVQTAGAPLAGVDFDVQGLKLSTESLADGFAKVTVDQGTFTASTHKAQFSALMQKALHASHDNSTSANLNKLATGLELPTFVVAVRTDGKWYVSAAYTVLEYIREYNQLPAADFGSGTRAATTLGAASPDAAVQDSMRALQQDDWAKILTMAPPDELPVYDYRDALTALADKSLANGTAQPKFTIDSMTTKSTVTGDTAQVTLDASGMTDSGKWSINGGCFAPPPPEGADTFAADSCIGADGYILGPLALLYGGFDASTHISVVRRDGRWFVSPVGTVLDSLDREIASLDRRTLYTMLDIPDQLPADGPLTLGTTVTLAASDAGPRVLSFAGKGGEQLLGLSTPMDKTYDSTPVYVRVFGPDGTELHQADGMFSGQVFTLPTDGTYKFVVAREYLSAGKEATVTVWDAADAPAAAKDNHGEQCTYTANGSSCSGVTSGSLVVPPATTEQPGETCTSTGNRKSCTSVTIAVPPEKSTGTTVEIGNGLSVTGSGPGTTAPVTVPAATSTTAGG